MPSSAGAGRLFMPFFATRDAVEAGPIHYHTVHQSRPSGNQIGRLAHRFSQAHNYVRTVTVFLFPVLPNWGVSRILIEDSISSGIVALSNDEPVNQRLYDAAAFFVRRIGRMRRARDARRSTVPFARRRSSGATSSFP